VLIAAIVIALRQGILRLFFGRIEADVMEAALTYLVISAISFPFLGIYNACAALFRAMGKSKVTFVVSTIGNIINVAGNAICIFGLQMGVAGVAIPTLISRVVMGLILFFSTLIKSNIMLLITGMMIGYITSSAISLLNFFATAEGVHSYMIWGMGNFSGVSLEQMPYFASFTLAGLILAILLIKPLNALLLGNRYAENLGVNIKRTRNLLLIATGILTAITTAFCGPVSFIGLAVPHIARLLLGTSNHNSLLPVTLLTGSAVALLCNLICILPGESGIIPLNAVTPVLGAPVIIYVIINQRRIQYFN
jgi:ABC-type Fe3+-siderophore transport system permease subunit